MKKIILFAIVAATLSLGACCFWGPEGDVYLSFDWTWTPEWFATDDDNLPDTIYRGALYETEEGSYYFEYYHAESGFTRWIYYTLEAYDGAFGFKGDDAVFELFLAAFDDPDLIQWQSEAGTPGVQPDAIVAAAATPHQPDQLVTRFERTIDRGGWRLEVRGGIVATE